MVEAEAVKIIVVEGGVAMVAVADEVEEAEDKVTLVERIWSQQRRQLRQARLCQS